MSRTPALNVRVLYAEGCPFTAKTIVALKTVATAMAVPVALERILVTTEQQARELRFLGSPTVQVEGLDLDPGARETAAVGFT